jgi:cellulose synthase/poly-beta-1,6-N-acetylglucosamine synthase-like glycosyltransferase
VDPRKLNKYLYIQKTPTWFVRGFYALGLLTWFPVAYGFFQAIQFDLFFRWVVWPVMIFLTIYYVFNYGLSLVYKKFDTKKHELLVRSFWKSKREPSVDVFLPICGEDMDMLRNTWMYVHQLPYRNKKVYVLDDSKRECAEHEQLAKKLGFTYLARPNKGWMKKAGNLRYGYEHSEGEFVVVFDADFAPHPDFLKELLPYMSDPSVGIVQSPQYFDMSAETHRASPLAYGAGQGQEFFYRFVQVARDRMGGTLCCGSNAIFRRTALAQVGGMSLVEHCEDAHTGFDLTDLGWVVRYVPVILAIGVCPDNAHAYFHQQHTWCSGCLAPLFSKKFWRSAVSWKVKACYIGCALGYLQHPFAIFMSLQVFWTLFMYNPYITFSGGNLFYPHMVWSFAILLYFPISRWRWGVCYAYFLQMYSSTHAIISLIFKKAVSRVATNAKRAGISNAFRQATLAVGAYVAIYAGLIGVAQYKGFLHLSDYNYYSVQFWLIYNFIFSVALLWQMTRTIVLARRTATKC